MTAWMQTGRGRPIDLSAPDLSGVDVAAEIAWPLAGTARFNAHQESNGPASRDPVYSVAQHCVVGADAVFDETRSVAAALAFLVHDAHEALIGDITTPTAQVIEEHVGVALDHVFGLGAEAKVRSAFGRGLVAVALAGLKAKIDCRVHRLAGLPLVLPPHILEIVGAMDRRMLDVERRQILGPTRGAPGDAIWPESVRRAEAVRIRGRLRPWPRHKAASEWLERWERWRIRPAATVTPLEPTSRDAADALARLWSDR